MSEGEDEQSAPAKQIRSEGTDAEFSEVAKKSDAASKSESKSERST
jgi:hypothetical protein